MKLLSKYISFFDQYTKYINTILVFFIIVICLNWGLYHVHFSDFIAINGDFQNYNGFRRLLDGQIPFKDFYFYLGLGPLYLNSLFLFILGNDFTTSLFVTNVLSAVMFSGALFITAYLVTGRNVRVALIWTFFLSVIAMEFFSQTNFSFFTYIKFFDYTEARLSARMHRAFLPFLLIVTALLLRHKKIWQHIEPWIQKHPLFTPVFIGMLLGFGIAWSNDYGVSAFLAGMITFVFVSARRKNRFLLRFFLCSTTAIVTALLSITLLTWGNTLEWIQYNFFGVAGYQFWYYNNNASDKMLLLQDLWIPVEVVFLFLILCYLAYVIRTKRASEDQIYLFFLFTTLIIANYIYLISNNRGGLLSPIQLVVYTIVFCYFFTDTIQNTIKKYYKEHSALFKKCIIAFFLFLTFFSFYRFSTSIYKVFTERKDAVYVKELNGYLRQFGPDIQAVQNIVKDKTFFSLYSSAFEVATGTFNPTGIDYVIHALGDEYRAMYLDRFKEFNPEYVFTINPEYVEWEDEWLMRANWFIFREIYDNYKPLRSFEYAILWQRSNDIPKIGINKEDITYTIDKKYDHGAVLIVDIGNKNISDVIVDVTVTYDAQWKSNRWLTRSVQKIIYVTDVNKFGYFLPAEKSTHTIPVFIKNGTGVVNFGGKPEKSVSFEILDVQINNVFPDLNYWEE